MDKEYTGLFIYSAKTCLRGKTPPRRGYLAPASEVAGTQWFDIGTSMFCFVNEICSWDIYMSIKA
jgi:hypothetical protein